MTNDETTPILIGTIGMSIMATFIIVFVILYRKAQFKFELERQQFKQALLAAEVEIREQTLEDVSMDLHDNIGQIASIVKMNLSIISENLSEEDHLRVTEAKVLLSKLIADIKSLTYLLDRKNYKHVSLLRLLEDDIARINRLELIDIKLENNLQSFKFNSETSIFLYRMYQEMLNNALKHSEATEALVEIYTFQGNLIFRFRDNGIGLDSFTVKPYLKHSNGKGMKNIMERCKIIGATVEVIGIRNKGTSITISLPT